MTKLTINGDLYSVHEKQKSQRGNKEYKKFYYYYKPHSNYHNFIKFNSVGNDTMGSPEYNVKLPKEAEQTSLEDFTNGVLKMTTFLDMTNE